MKTIIETVGKGRISIQSREEVIKESLENGLKPRRVSNDRAQELVRQGSHAYAPKSLLKDGDTHYVNTSCENESNVVGETLVKI